MSNRRFLSSAWKTGNGLNFIEQHDSNHSRKTERGHLVSLALPDAYGYTKTAEEDLPMLPEPFRLVSRQVRTDRGMVPDLAASKQFLPPRNS